MASITAYGYELAPLIIALIGIATQLGMPKKIAPLLSLVLGITFSFLFAPQLIWQETVLIGLGLGLSSIGLHSGVKNIYQSTLSVQNKTKNDSAGKNAGQ